ncbi:hypothetical protein LTR37_014747 [Vermiconidia calcicola]|uniref:Uncharacterized protein n=1 Tax=Vermiconidia calcicola TaxID=1690605 RepID=A0ACC3MTL3_9PEZI|nr:hypothetical protein LTR37_014747 [Vermiconidia calcicola]
MSEKPEEPSDSKVSSRGDGEAPDSIQSLPGPSRHSDVQVSHVRVQMADNCIKPGTPGMRAPEDEVSNVTDEVANNNTTLSATAARPPREKSPAPMESFVVAEAAAARTKTRLFMILLANYLALFIAALDQTIMATSIPTISADLGSASGYVWIGGAYLLAHAAAGPLWAKFSDIWGRKPAILGAVALFAAGSTVAALSQTMRMLIAARALQGTAGGGLIQLVNITICDLFSMRKRTLYLGLVEMTWGFAGGAGPLLGGALTQLASWRYCFWINLPVCAISFALVLIFLDVHNPRTTFFSGIKAIDWLGTLSILAVVLMVLLGLEFGSTILPWSSPTVIYLIVFGIAMVGCFIFSEKKASYPLMPLDMFTRKNNVAFLLCFVHGLVYIAAEYYLPLYFQSVKRASPIRSGVLILPVTVSEATTAFFVGVLVHRIGRYTEVIWAGSVLMTTGIGLYIHFGVHTTVAEIVACGVLGGIGVGLLSEGPLLAIQNSVSQANTATATAAFGFVRNMATSISIVIGGVIFQNGMDGQHSALRVIGIDNAMLDALSGGKAAANLELIDSIEDLAQRGVVLQAFANSLRNIWIAFTCISAISVLAGIFIQQKRLSTEHIEARTGILSLAEREARVLA